jgi:hypothetical protein
MALRIVKTVTHFGAFMVTSLSYAPVSRSELTQRVCHSKICFELDSYVSRAGNLAVKK